MVVEGFPSFPYNGSCGTLSPFWRLIAAGLRCGVGKSAWILCFALFHLVLVMYVLLFQLTSGY